MISMWWKPPRLSLSPDARSPISGPPTTSPNLGHRDHTDQGNIIFTSDFVVENNANPNYLHDMNAIAKIAEIPTLVLLTESSMPPARATPRRITNSPRSSNKR
jgi:hypothetical protein